MTPEGMTARPSNHGPKETMDRLAAAVTARGMTVLARIDHAAAAANVGLELRPTEVLIFGNPKAGTPLMHEHPAFALALPLEVVVWEEDGVRVTFPVMAQLARDHGLADDDPRIAAMDRLLGVLADSLA